MILPSEAKAATIMRKIALDLSRMADDGGIVLMPTEMRDMLVKVLAFAADYVESDPKAH